MRKLIILAVAMAMIMLIAPPAAATANFDCPGRPTTGGSNGQAIFQLEYADTPEEQLKDINGEGWVCEVWVPVGGPRVEEYRLVAIIDNTVPYCWYTGSC